MNALVFQSATLNPVRQNDGQIWVTASDLAKALGYKQVDAVSRIFDRNSDEFLCNMSQTVKLTVSNKNNELQDVKARIFSLRGAHLIAMFARTPVAKEFRKWVLDVIEKKESKPKKQIDMSMYVSKDVHNNLALKYHRMFRQYDDMIDTMRAQVEDMQRKCRRYDFKMARSAISIEEAANVLKVPVSKIKKVLEDEYIIQERCTYVEHNKPILKVTERGKSFDLVFIQNEIGKNGVDEVIMINEDGMAYLNGRV